MEKKDLAPEVVAAITAAVHELMGSQLVAVRIKRNEVWSLAARMDR